MLLVREKREVSTSEVAASFGKTRASGGIKRILIALVEDCILETTSEKRARNRFQKYRLTAKGRRLAASLAKKKCRYTGFGMSGYRLGWGRYTDWVRVGSSD